MERCIKLHPLAKWGLIIGVAYIGLHILDGLFFGHTILNWVKAFG